MCMVSKGWEHPRSAARALMLQRQLSQSRGTGWGLPSPPSAWPRVGSPLPSRWPAAGIPVRLVLQKAELTFQATLWVLNISYMVFPSSKTCVLEQTHIACRESCGGGGHPDKANIKMMFNVEGFLWWCHQDVLCSYHVIFSNVLIIHTAGVLKAVEENPLYSMSAFHFLGFL